MSAFTNRRNGFSLAVVLVAAAWAAAGEAARVTVAVDAAEKVGPPISPLITGKFAEHLHANIYGGMSAQVLQNPTFADWPFATGGQTPDGRPRFLSEEDRIADAIRSFARRYDWPRDQVQLLMEAREDALAHGWVRVGGRGDVRTSPDVGPYGGRAQRVEVRRAGDGIAQWTYLPLHRVRAYSVELMVRSPDTKALDVMLVAEGAAQPAARATVGGIGGEWKLHRVELKLPDSAPADAVYRLSLTSTAPGQWVIARALLWPADHVNGADADVVRLLKESRLPILRWPGGNFVSGYRWEDGVGPMERRPTHPNWAWGGLEPNLFGTDEFIAFCRSVGCEPMICINAGDGTPEEAARWIEYCNGPATSPMGAKRAANGHPQPYNIRRWEVGNELWGRWQVSWTTPRGNADRYRRFAAAMLNADPTIQLYACGAPVLWGEEWNLTLFREAGDVVKATTDHPLIGGDVPAATDPLDVYRDFMGVPDLLEKRWDRMRRQMMEAGIREPRLAVTELQMFAHIGGGGGERRLSSGNLVSPSTQAEALYDVLMYHAAVRLAPFVEMVTHSATVNHGGGLRKSRERVYAQPCHWAQASFAAFAGATPVRVTVDGPVEQAPRVLPDIKGAGPQSYGRVAALAAVGRDGSLRLSLVHRGTDGPARVSIALEGFAAAGSAEVWSLSADVPWARNSLEDPGAVSPKAARAAVTNGRLEVEMPAFTVMRITIDPRR